MSAGYAALGPEAGRFEPAEELNLVALISGEGSESLKKFDKQSTFLDKFIPLAMPARELRRWHIPRR